MYIRKVHGNKCDVNLVTSLTEPTGELIENKIKKVKKGYLYPIPYKDANFSRWSAFDLSIIKNVDVSKVVSIGEKSVKRRHKFFVGKFSK